MLVIAPHAARVYATQYSCSLLFACFGGEKKYLCPASVRVCIICEPASHASQHASHASQQASHASHCLRARSWEHAVIG